MHKEEENGYKPVRAINFWSNNHIEYKINSDKNKALSVEEYLNKIRPYLKDVINDLKKSDTLKIQLTVKVNFLSSKDDNDEKRAIQWNSDSIEIMINDKADKVIKQLSKSLKNRYQNNLESIKGSEFVFDMFIYYIINVIK